MEEPVEIANEYFDSKTDEVYVQNPCKVVNVNGNYVDVLLYINDDEPDTIIYNVPIIRPAETQRAYIFLGIKEGDRGVCRFFDRSTEAYLQSDFDYNSDDRQHDINDRCFELGFIPDKEAFVYPTDKEIEIGLKNAKFKISVDENGNIAIVSEGTATITCPTVNHTGDINITGTVTVDGDVIANNISLKNHTHTGNLGSPTSPPNT